MAKQISTDPKNRMNPGYKFGIWLGMRNNSEAGEIGRLEPQRRWHKEAVQERNWSTFENNRRKVDSEQTRNPSGPDPNPATSHCKEHESVGKESPSKTSTNSEPLLDAMVAMQSKTTKGRTPIQIVAECKKCLRITPHGTERLDRRGEVIYETLA